MDPYFLIINSPCAPLAQGNLLPSAKGIKEYFFSEKEKFNPALFDINEKFNYPVRVSVELKKLAKKTKAEIERVHHDN